MYGVNYRNSLFFRLPNFCIKSFALKIFGQTKLNKNNLKLCMVGINWESLHVYRYGGKGGGLLCQRVPCIQDYLSSCSWGSTDMQEGANQQCWQVCGSSTEGRNDYWTLTVEDVEFVLCFWEEAAPYVVKWLVVGVIPAIYHKEGSRYHALCCL